MKCRLHCHHISPLQYSNEFPIQFVCMVIFCFVFSFVIVAVVVTGFWCWQVSWIRRTDFQLLTVGLSTYSSDDRFLVEHARHMGHWSLRIKSVRDDDRGLYECQLSIHPTQSIFIELKVVGEYRAICTYISK